MNEPIITLRDVKKTFTVGEETVHGLRNISLQIDSGEYIAVMGPSGSGKSTLLNTIGLLDQPDSGQYLLEKRSITDLSDDERTLIRRERIGFIFQFFHLIPRLSARENIELPLMLSGIAPAVRHKKVTEILELVGLGERAKHRPDQLSGGQRQRVAIARATVTQPAVLLADEPTGNLDRSSGHEIIKILENLNAGGLTILMVTHDPELGQRAHRRIRMDDGAILDGEG